MLVTFHQNISLANRAFPLIGMLNFAAEKEYSVRWKTT